MKIAHILPNLETGGCQSVVFCLVHGLPDHEHYIVTNEEPHIKVANVKHVWGEKHECLNEIKPDIIYFPGAVTNGTMDVERLTFKPERILWVAQTISPKVKPFPGATHYGAVSEYGKSVVAWRGIVDHRKVAVIPNAVLPKFFSKELRDQVRFENRLVGCVSRVARSKFHESYTDVLKNAGVKNFKLVGGGEYLNELLKRMAANSVSCTSTGDVVHHNIATELSDLSVFFHATSTWIESWSLAISEALALGVPVVCDDIGGNREVVGGGKYGILVPHWKMDTLTPRAIRELLSNEKMWKRMSEDGKQYADEFLTCVALGKRTMETLGYEYKSSKSYPVCVEKKEKHNDMDESVCADIDVRGKGYVLFIARFNACETTLMPIVGACKKAGIDAVYCRTDGNKRVHKDIIENAGCVVVGMGGPELRNTIYPICKTKGVPVVYMAHGRFAQPRMKPPAVTAWLNATHVIVFCEQQKLVLDGHNVDASVHVLGSVRLQEMMNKQRHPGKILFCPPMLTPTTTHGVNQFPTEIGWKAWVEELYRVVGNNFMVSPHYRDSEKDAMIRYCEQRGIEIVDGDPALLLERTSVAIVRFLSTQLIEANAYGVPVILTDVADQGKHNFEFLWFDNKRVHWRATIEASVKLAAEIDAQGSLERVEKLSDWFYVRNDNAMQDIIDLIVSVKKDAEPDSGEGCEGDECNSTDLPITETVEEDTE